MFVHKRNKGKFFVVNMTREYLDSTSETKFPGLLVKTTLWELLSHDNDLFFIYDD